MESEKLSVVLVSDAVFGTQLSVTIYSLIKSNKHFKEIDFYIIDAGLKNEQKKLIETLILNNKFHVFFLKPPSLNNAITVGNGLNISTYYRLFLASLLPLQLCKVMYLDADLLIKDDLIDLWNTDLDDCSLAGIPDVQPMDVRKAVGLKQDQCYINAGVLLINLDYWRKNNLESRFLSYIDENGGKVKYNDQGVLNHICSNSKKILSLRYNIMPEHLRYNAEQINKLMDFPFVSKEDLNTAKSNPAIIHFAGNNYKRPWAEKCTHPYTDEYRKIAEHFGFETVLVQDCNKYRLRRFLDKLPFFIYASLRKIRRYIIN